ncbi:MAG: diacylglycerol kinase family protein [Rhizobiaceae bacterium]
MKICVILNPQAGAGRAGASWPQFSALLEEAVGEFELKRTSAPGDASHLARKAIFDGTELIIAVGGDGTTNEVANGFIDGNGQISTSCALAIVPCGTGSDFCRTLGVDSDPAKAISGLSARSERSIDVGVAHFQSSGRMLVSRLFLNIASFGLSGVISRNMYLAGRSQLLPIKLRYLVETFRGLSSYHPANIRLAVDEAVFEGEVTLVAIANGQYFGGGMMVAPNASPQDGLFDVIVLRAITKSRLARKIALVYRGAHLSLPEIAVFRGSRIVAEADNRTSQNPVYLELDGENPGTLNCEIVVRPKALRLMQ